MLGGIAMMVGAFVPGEEKVWVLLTVIIFMVLIPFVYSILIYLKKNKSQEN